MYSLDRPLPCNKAEKLKADCSINAKCSIQNGYTSCHCKQPDYHGNGKSCTCKCVQKQNVVINSY